MRRRTAGLILAVMVWGGSTTAGAQTTTTSSSTSSSTTSTSTVAPTSTTLPNPCAGQPCTPQPPDAFVSGVNGEVRLDRGSSCWRSPSPDANGGFVGLCVDVLLRDPDAVLVVRAGETLTLRFATAMSPTFVQLERGGQTTALTPGNPVRFGADLPVGSHVVRFFTRWLQGDMGHSVRLDVRAAGGPATPTRGNIALTG
ncbi:MAG TPA: hypothetical protein VGV86_07960 [Acidimicrobiales bacterium]|nr:hypothetical protein [Acidimicrobiales bacterium]